MITIADLEKAIIYVREQLHAEDIAEIHAQIDRAYRSHLAPSDCVTKTDCVRDLLEEYGADNDLPEGWWENYCEIDDILFEL